MYTIHETHWMNFQMCCYARVLYVCCSLHLSQCDLPGIIKQILYWLACTRSMTSCRMYMQFHGSMRVPRLVDRLWKLSIAYLCVLQMTAFAARLALDCQRVQAGNIDCVPCVKLSSQKLHSRSSESSGQPDAADAPDTETMTRQIDLALAQMPAAEAAPAAAATASETPDLPQVAPPDAESSSHDGSEQSSRQSLTGRFKAFGRSITGAAKGGQSDGRRGRQQGGDGGGGQVYGVTPALHWYMENVHAPFLAKPAVQLVMLAVFVGLFMLSLAALPHVSR